MIYTVTLNPSVDYLMEMDQLLEGSLNRSRTENYFPGGKGINVSRILRRLDTESTALGFTGGFTGEFIKEYLNDEGIMTKFVNVNGTSRINVKVLTDTETELNANGPLIKSENTEELLSMISQMTSTDILVLAGSVPSSMPDDFYRQMAQIASEKEVKLVIDAEKKLLQPVLEYHPFLLKPNHHELGDFYGVKIETIENAVHYGKKLLSEGVSYLIVSMAEKGALLFHEDRVFYAKSPEGTLISSVGAGDSMVAGFLSAVSKNIPSEEAFRWGAAAGTATAFSMGLADEQDIKSLLDQIEIKELIEE
ncbi:1-phosphofructokinase [Falsibacillus pallidus]|uniref:1-phosphofructokinase n=1 Tax=Falsibacillus pallidus TaxID=493781 RepID=UPI003D9817E4